MRTNRILPSVAAIALAACADIPAGPAAGPAASFDAAWSRWQAAAPVQYQYDVQVICYCIPERTRPVHVVVADGQTVTLLYADSLTAADSTMFADVRTMDRLFARLRGILDGDPDLFEATYDANLGYPLTVNVDLSTQTADEEVYYRVTNFTPRLR